jgi:hypothetical protein
LESEELGVEAREFCFEGLKFFFGAIGIAGFAHGFEVAGGGDNLRGAENGGGSLERVGCGREVCRIFLGYGAANSRDFLRGIGEEGFHKRLSELLVSAGRAREVRGDID